MDYSRIRNAIDREIHIDGLNQGGLCTLNGPSYYIIHVSVDGQFSAEFEILNKEIYTIRSYSATDDATKFKASIDNTGKFFFSLSPATDATLRLGVEYTNSSVTISNDTDTSVGTEYNFGKLYVLEALEFNGTGVGVNSLDISELNIDNFTSKNTTLNLNDKPVENIGDLHVKELHLDIMDVDTLYADTIDSENVKLGNWTLTKSNNGNTITIRVS